MAFFYVFQKMLHFTVSCLVKAWNWTKTNFKKISFQTPIFDTPGVTLNKTETLKEMYRILYRFYKSIISFWIKLKSFSTKMSLLLSFPSLLCSLIVSLPIFIIILLPWNSFFAGASRNLRPFYFSSSPIISLYWNFRQVCKWNRARMGLLQTLFNLFGAKLVFIWIIFLF